MKQNYYYVVSGLPDIIIDNQKKETAFSDIFNEVLDLVSPPDAQILKLFRLHIDNKNLLNMLSISKNPFISGGNFTREEIEIEIKYPDILPSYMHSFIESYKEEYNLFENYSREDQLSWLFYALTTNHSNYFIRQWFQFDLDIRNVLAAINYRTFLKDRPIQLETSLIGDNTVTQSILKSSAPDFSLSQTLPWIDDVLSAHNKNLSDFERSVDDLRWHILDELTIFSYFQIETICAFIVKLGIVERWQKLDNITGEKALNTLLNDLQMKSLSR